MSKTGKQWIGVVFGAGLATAMLASNGLADEDTRSDGNESYHHDYIYGVPDQPTQAWQLASGGRIYDSWFAALDREPPAKTHPAWPEFNLRKMGAQTWRCKSCHGWDYKGIDGQYGTGSYKTGIKGVSDLAGGDPDAVVRALGDDIHGFTDEMIPPDAKRRVALFLTSGQHDTDAVIALDGAARGTASQGASVYQTVCAACHGFDGRALNWGDEVEPGYVGTEANANPWEVLHKIRNGHPGHEMISLRAFPLQVAVDVLAYAQSLPVK